MAGRTTHVLHNLSAGLINRIVRLAFEFIMRTVMIRTLGAEYLGLGSLFTSILQMLSLAELGFGTAAVFSMYRPIVENNTEKICALLRVYRRFYHTVGVVILLLGLALIPFLDRLVSGTYPSGINITALYLIYLANTVISYFLFAYKVTLFTAHQRDDIRRNIDTAMHTLMYLLQIVVLVFVRNYYWYALFFPLSTIAINLYQGALARKYYPKYVCAGNLERKETVDLTKRVVGMLSYQIGGVIYNNADVVVVSAFLGLTVLAKFTNYYYIVSGLTAVLTIVSDAMTASVGNSIVTEDLGKNQNMFDQLSLLFAWVTGWWSICLFVLFQPFMTIWMGKENLLPINNVFFFALYFYFVNCTIPIGLYKKAAGIWWEDKIRPLVGIAMNLALNIWWVTIIGIDGVVLSSIVNTALVSIPWAAYFLFKCYLKKGLAAYLGKQLLLFIVTLVIGTATCGICWLLPRGSGIIYLMMLALVCLIVPNSLYFAFFRMTGDWEKVRRVFQIIMKNVKGRAAQ